MTQVFYLKISTHLNERFAFEHGVFFSLFFFSFRPLLYHTYVIERERVLGLDKRRTSRLLKMTGQLLAIRGPGGGWGC